ncbi:FtsB family cell division protein [Methylobacterium oryzihabitans]|jgi:cell division protein FtsB|uniref:Septum formation initiator family protein n=1 Tax=Methylobacterium oryzihabitans TaxID=2499852 RepID=A0A3S2V7R4_9HYPH|nr:septum formation initiator family protein [Methylobacterium oryzihabitans]RVU17741.1 septum formation initiator family protein [Methylobacterium oryzihabitans]
MVVRKRARAILLPLGLYAVSALAAVYFVREAQTGSRGLEAKRALKIQAYGLQQDLNAAREDRTEWERRVALLRSDQIDRDLLEERARLVLGRVHPNDVVIFTP